MYLNQDPETGYWTVGEAGYNLTNVHDPKLCEDRGCGIHNHPSEHHLKEAPMNWRVDRGILERMCPHGVGHPDYDSAEYLASVGHGYENVHGCDGCCMGITFN